MKRTRDNRLHDTLYGVGPAWLREDPARVAAQRERAYQRALHVATRLRGSLSDACIRGVDRIAFTLYIETRRNRGR